METKNRVKQTFKSHPVMVQLQRARRVVEAVEMHPSGGPSTCGYPETRALLDNATAAVAEAARLRSQAQARAAECNRLLRQLGSYARSLAGMVKSAGKRSKPAKLAVGRLPAPGGLRAKAGPAAGTIEFRFQSLGGRCDYFVEISTNPKDPLSWEQAASTTAAKCVVKGLKSGTTYWLRVAANNAHGLSPWSNVVSARAG